jgi:hypothetical protein
MGEWLAFQSPSASKVSYSVPCHPTRSRVASGRMSKDGPCDKRHHYVRDVG